MRKLTFFLMIMLLNLVSFAQSTYPEDVKTSFETIKKSAFKNSYQYVITYDDAVNASMLVKPNSDYLIYFVYDNTDHPVPVFKAYLMTPDNAVKKKYTSKSSDLGQIGVARVAQIKFSTPAQFANDKDQLPVKIEANPKAKIYIFERRKG